MDIFGYVTAVISIVVCGTIAIVAAYYTIRNLPDVAKAFGLSGVMVGTLLTVMSGISFLLKRSEYDSDIAGYGILSLLLGVMMLLLANKYGKTYENFRQKTADKLSDKFDRMISK